MNVRYYEVKSVSDETVDIFVTVNVAMTQSDEKRGKQREESMRIWRLLANDNDIDHLIVGSDEAEIMDVFTRHMGERFKRQVNWELITDTGEKIAGVWLP